MSDVASAVRLGPDSIIEKFSSKLQLPRATDDQSPDFLRPSHADILVDSWTSPSGRMICPVLGREDKLKIAMLVRCGAKLQRGTEDVAQVEEPPN